MHRTPWIIGLASALSGLAACGSGDPIAPAASEQGPAPVTGPTFHKDIEPILQKSCLGCHSPGNIAPFSLTSYASARAYAPLMAEQTALGIMPPFGADDTDECKPRHGWKDDLRLGDAEIEAIQAWSDAGAPEGSPADAPEAFVPKGMGLSRVDGETAPRKPFVTSGDKDEFRCFTLDAGLTKDVFLRGMQIVPGNTRVVHHVLVYTDPEGQGASKADADGGYDCFGGPGVDRAALVMAWAPGAVPVELPSNIGMHVKAGTRFVMQVHYHPAGQTGDPDSTKFQIRYDDTPPEYNYGVALVGNLGPQEGLLPGPDDGGNVEFRVPANVKGHTETMRFVSPEGAPDFYIYGVGTHMHYVGTDMKIDIEHVSPAAGEPEKECLLETPRWSFDWQRLYTYDGDIASLPVARPGDVSTYRCTYDNTMENPYVLRALKDAKLSAPTDVYLGETTLDEMCLGVFALLYKGDPIDL